MERRQFLQIPGPTNVPDRILRALSKPLINHRGEEFEQLLSYCVESLKKVFRTDKDILIFPAAGSGMLESAVVNLFSKDDTILTSSIGVFSERMGIIAQRFGLNIIEIEKVWGEAVTPGDIRRYLEDDKEKEIKAVCVPQNETCSAVQVDIEGIAKVIKDLSHPALLVVDAISSAACSPLETDEWGVDVVLASSQKGFMLPPGLGFAVVNEKAWKSFDDSDLPRWYWDYSMVKQKMLTNQLPYTPATTLLFGLKEALDIIHEEGIENVWKRHEAMATAVRAACDEMGLKLLADEKAASNTVTAIMLPENIEYKQLSELLKKKYNVTIGGGLGKLQGKIFRIGHLGAVYEMDIYAVMGALEMALIELGYKVEPGSAAKALTRAFV